MKLTQNANYYDWRHLKHKKKITVWAIYAHTVKFCYPYMPSYLSGLYIQFDAS